MSYGWRRCGLISVGNWEDVCLPMAFVIYIYLFPPLLFSFFFPVFWLSLTVCLPRSAGWLVLPDQTNYVCVCDALVISKHENMPYRYRFLAGTGRYSWIQSSPFTEKVLHVGPVAIDDTISSYVNGTVFVYFRLPSVIHHLREVKEKEKKKKHGWLRFYICTWQYG